MSSEKPTILLVPGAWLPVVNYADYTSALEAEGFPVIAIAYPSIGSADPLTATCESDSLYLRSTIDDVISKGKELVIISHSYGNMPASAAAKGRSIVERKKDGKAGGVVGLICIAALLTPEGLCCTDATGGNLAPWILEDTPSKGVNLPNDPIKVFSHDQSPDYNKRMADSLRPQATRAFRSPQPPPAHLDSAFKGRLGYLVTRQDVALPPSAQHAMVNGTGVDWILQEMDGSHMAPFGSRSLESIEAVKFMIAQFCKA